MIIDWQEIELATLIKLIVYRRFIARDANLSGVKFYAQVKVMYVFSYDVITYVRQIVTWYQDGIELQINRYAMHA